MATFRKQVRQFNYALDEHLSRAVKWILLANIVVFLLDVLLIAPLGLETLFLEIFAQNPVVQPVRTGDELVLDINWLAGMQFFTYMFLHADFWHLFWNMLGLYFFGPPMEYHFGTTRFAKYYLICGFLAGMTHGLIAPFFFGFGRDYVMLGASGAVLAVLLAFGYSFPHQRILLWFIVPIPARVLVILIGFLTVMALFHGRQTNVSDLTHLAGLGFGLLWIYLRERFPYWWPFNDDPAPFSRHVEPPPRYGRY